MRRDQRGYSLPEVLVALVILGLVITISLAAFVERNRRLQQASEIILAWQVLSNEAEYWRRVDYGELKGTADFRSRLDLLEPLGPYAATVAVADLEPNVKSVTLTIRWREGKRHERLMLVRVHTGGSTLW
jgi:prepilin-type N-terminal cleavage/methylation domain-containing protein